MKFKKLLAGVCAMSIAASMMAVSASAAVVGDGVQDGNYTFEFVGDVNEIVGENKGLIAGDDFVTVRVVLDGNIEVQDDGNGNDTALLWNEGKDGGAGYDGFGGGIIVNHGAGWDQQQWGNSGSDYIVKWNEDETEFYFERDISGIISDEDISAAEGTWCSICVSSWWGGDFSVKRVELLDADGNPVVDADAANARKEAREKAAADAITTLGAENDLTIVEKLETAADALSNIDKIMKEADDEIAAIDKVLADAEETIAGLRECDTYDKDAYEAAKKAAEDDKAAIIAAQEKLQAAKDALDAQNAAEKKELQDKIDALNKQIEELEADAKTNADKIAALEAEKAALEKQLDDAEKNPSAGTGAGAGTTGGKADNPGTGVTAGLALAGLALAGAAVVASKKRK